MAHTEETVNGLSGHLILKKIMDGLPIGVYVLLNDKPLFFNHVFCELTGIPRDELEQHGLAELLKVTPRGEEFAREIFEKVKSGELDHHIWDNPLTRQDGSQVVLRCIISRIELGSQYAVVLSLRDITEKKKAEQELEMQNEIFRLIGENTADLIYVHDPDSKISYMSPAIERIIGYKAEEWYDHYTEFIVDNERFAFAKKATQIALETGKKQPPYLVDLITKEGKRRVMEIRETPYKRRKKVAGIVGVGRDITERLEYEDRLRKINEKIEKKNAELQKANREMEAFLYTVSHDLKAPIVTLQGMTDRLMKRSGDVLDERSRHYLTRIKVNIDRLEELVLDLLELSRIGRIEDAREACDIAEIIKESLDEIEDTVKKHGVEVTYPDDLGVTFYSRKRLRQVIINLITNAVKYRNEDNHAELKIESVRSGDKWIVRFIDNGRGIDPRFHKKIFEAFQRPGSKKTDEGTGIGLTIAKRIVEYNKGEIWVESELGKGSTFSITVPVKEDTV